MMNHVRTGGVGQDIAQTERGLARRKLVPVIVAVMILASVIPMAGRVGLAPEAGAAVPAMGTVYVADSAENRVFKIDDDGSQTDIAPGAWTYPAGVAVGADGWLYVADRGSNRVLEVRPGSGAASPVGNGFSLPSGVAIADDGTLYVADSGNNRVVAVSPNGSQRVVMSGLSNPSDVDVDALGNVYVADSGNGRVVEVAQDGAQTVIVSGLAKPVGVTADPTGTVYVADSTGNQVLAIAADGTRRVITTDVYRPTAVAVDSTGRVHVADTGNGRTVVVDTTGSQSTMAGDLSSPSGLDVYAPAPTPAAATPPAETIVGAPYSFTFHAFSAPGEPEARFDIGNGALPPGLDLTPAGLLGGSPTASGVFTFRVLVHNAAHATLGPESTITVRSAPNPEDLYLASSGTDQLLRLAGPGYRVPDDLETLGTHAYPYGVGLDVAGNLYVTDTAHDKVTRIAPGGQTSQVGSGLNSPTDVVADPAGNVYILDSGNGRVVQVTPEGNNVDAVTGLHHPRAMAIDASGALYIADTGYNRIVRMPRGAGPEVDASDVLYHLSKPYGVALAGDGSIYVSAWQRDKLVKLQPDPNGGTPTAADFGSGLDRPAGVAVDHEGNVYVADPGFPGVVEFAPDGASTFHAGSAPRVTYFDATDVAVYLPSPSLTADRPPATIPVGESFGFTFDTSNPSGDVAPTFSVASGELPPGLILDASSGELAGVPTATGTYSFTVKVANFVTGTVSLPITIDVTQAPAITEATPAVGVIGSPYRYTFHASGFPAPRFALDAGNLPDGLTLSANGVLAGTPTEAGVFPITVRATSTTGTVTTGSVDVTIADHALFTQADPPDQALVATPYDYRFVATGLTDEVYEVASGALPPGLALDPVSGTLGGSPTVVGVYRFTIAAHDGVSSVTSPTLMITVMAPPHLVANPPTTAQVGTPYSYTFDVSGNPQPALSLASGGLPGGLTLTSSGLLSGTPNMAGEFTFTVEAANAAGTVTSGTLHITVNAPPAFVSAAPPTKAVFDAPYACTFVATGAPAVTFSVENGALPPGMSLDPSTGQISGRPNVYGTFSFVVMAENSLGHALTGTLTITVGSRDAAYVKAAFADFLGRPPTEDQLRVATAHSYPDTASRRSFVDGLARSNEWIEVTVEKMYVDTLGRPGEAAGVGFWVDQIKSGRRTVSQVAASFYASSEYFDGIGNSDARTWVLDLYTKLLERDGASDTSGVDYWVAQTRARGRSWVAYRFFQSSESCHLRVATLYQALLGRAPDPDGWDYWSGRVNELGDLALAAYLASSSEYYTRANLRFG